MKNFKEIKKDAKELKAKAKIFVTEHENEIKNGLAFAAGVVVTTIIQDKLYGIGEGSHRTMTVVMNTERDQIGIKNQYYNKHNKVRKQLTDIFVFDSPGEAMDLGERLIDAARELGYSRDEEKTDD